MMKFIHSWSELPAWLRLGIALLFIAISTAVWFFGDIIWPWGWAVGVILLLFSGPSSSEKKGYKF